MKFQHIFVNEFINSGGVADYLCSRELVNMQLDKMGQEGWELVSTVYDGEKYGLFFKRPAK